LRFLRPRVASAFLAFGTACGGGDLGLPDETRPADINAVGGNGQSGDVGAELPDPLIVEVTDGQGAPAGEVGVAFTLGAGAEGGSTAPDTAVTDSAGRASVRWTLGGSAGQQELLARVVGRDLQVRFTAQASRTSSLTLELASGDGQSGPPGEPLAEPLVVRLVDEGGDGVRGRAVSWVVAAGGGDAGPQSSDTDGDGFASTTWTLGGAVGANTLNAVVSGVGVVSFTATAVGSGGQPSATESSVSASPTSIEALLGSSTITVTVRDDAANPIAGAVVTLSASGSGNLLTQPAGPTGSDGIATGMLQSVVPETKVITAAVNGTLAIEQTAQVTVTATSGTADHLVFLVQPGTVKESQEIVPAVEVAIVDQVGGIVPESGIEIELDLLREDGDERNNRLDGERRRLTVNGVAVFPGLSVGRSDANYRLRASVRGSDDLGTAESDPFDVED
jgi:hypothetical protein